LMLLCFSLARNRLYLGGLAVALGGAAFYFFGMGQSPEGQGKNVATAVKGAKATVEAATGMKRDKEDYQKVYVLA
jgi:hypothetical protein